MAPGTERLRLGGYAELQLRGLSDGFDVDEWYLSQWAWILNLEPEWDIASEGWGPFDTISAFARIQVRYECVWSGCGLANSWRHFGNRAREAPAHNWADGLSERFEGPIELPPVGIPVRPLQDGLALADITSAQHTSRATENGVPPEIVDAAFGPLIDDVFTYKRIDGLGTNGIGDTIAPPLGPWRPESRIRPNGALALKGSHVVGAPAAARLVEHVRAVRAPARAARRLRLVRPELPPDRARVEPRGQPGRVGAEGGLRRPRPVRVAALAPGRQADDRLGQD